jgi:hypothetical protein
MTERADNTQPGELADVPRQPQTAARGYTRRQAAEIVGVSMRSVDYYKAKGVFTGRKQFIEGRGHMLILSESDIEALKTHRLEMEAKQPDGLRTYRFGPDAPPAEPPPPEPVVEPDTPPQENTP